MLSNKLTLGLNHNKLESGFLFLKVHFTNKFCMHLKFLKFPAESRNIFSQVGRRYPCFKSSGESLSVAKTKGWKEWTTEADSIKTERQSTGGTVSLRTQKGICLALAEMVNRNESAWSTGKRYYVRSVLIFKITDLP